MIPEPEKKLNLIILIDDDRAINFIHERQIKALDLANQVISFTEPTEALKFLFTKINGLLPQPALLLLDINMPGLNGWEFLDEYYRLKQEPKNELTIAMVTADVRAEDFRKIREHNVVGIYDKPLSRKVIQKIIEENPGIS